MVVRATGPASEDQSIYLGTYRQIVNYNDHAAYALEGSEQLYIYYFSSVVSPIFFPPKSLNFPARNKDLSLPKKKK